MRAGRTWQSPACARGGGIARRLRGAATPPCSIIPICAAACHTTFLTETIPFYDQLRISFSRMRLGRIGHACTTRFASMCAARRAAGRGNIGAETPKHRVAPPTQMRRYEGEADPPLAVGSVRHIDVQREYYAQPRNVAANRRSAKARQRALPRRRLEKWQKSVMHPCVRCVSLICGSDAKHRGPATRRSGATVSQRRRRSMPRRQCAPGKSFRRWPRAARRVRQATKARPR